jgi:Zn-dependent protease with chaperone function
MFDGYPGATFGGFLLALLPATLRWWWGRALAHAAEDALIAERLAAHQSRCGVVAGVCGGLLVVGLPSTTPFTLPLLIAAYTAAGFPLRQKLFGETWSLAAYLAFVGRLLLAVFGFWMLLALLPWAGLAAFPRTWMVTCAGVGVLAAWSYYYAAVTRWILRSEPITDAALLESFHKVAAKAGIAPPRFECVRMGGGVLANALALPSLRGASVIFTDTLLARLTHDEIVAISAHEIAHLEYYNGQRMRRLAVVNAVLIALAAVTTPMSVWWVPARDAYVGTIIFPAAMFIAMAARGRHRQRNETASDLRAVELTGHPEALVSGLTALHTIGRVPRRWDARREQSATHPSLARRIRDIRAASGLAAPAPETARTFPAADGGRVTFEHAHLTWQEHHGATHLLNYDALSDLRLHASPAGAISLVAVERQGRRWQMTPRTEDRAALQATLDQVDGRLTPETPVQIFSALVTRMVAGLALCLSILVAQFAVAFIALLALLSAAPAFLNAAAFAAFVAGAVLLRDSAHPGSLGTPGAIMLFAVGCVLLGVGYARRGQTSRMSTPFAVVLACCALLSLGAIGLGGLDPIRLHQGARGLPEATVFLVGLAGACWTWRRKALRYASLTAALAGAATTMLSTSVFLDAAGRDPVLVSAPYLKEARSTPIPIAELEVPFEVGSLLVSPHGELVAAREDEEDLPRQRTPVFYAGRPTAQLSPIDALDLVFVDDRRALALASVEGGLEVRVIVFDAKPRIQSREVLPGLRTGQLRYRSADDRWIVLGHNHESRFVRAEGTPGVTGVQTSTWGPLTASGGWLQAVGTKDAAAIVVEQRYRSGVLSRLWSLGLASGLGRGYYTEIHINRIVNGSRIEVGRSLLEAGCDALETDALLCAAYDGTRTRIVTIDPQTSAIEPVATVDGRFWTMDVASRGWIVGWNDAAPVAIRLSTREVLRPPSAGDEFVASMGVSDGALATAAPIDEGSRVRIYRTGGR